jgi:hypothetical protein
MTTGDPCRVCGGPEPPRLRLVVPAPPETPNELREKLGATWRVVGVQRLADGRTVERHDWVCFAEIVWLAEELGLVARGSHEVFRRLAA